jgi:hypothetical protein
VSRILPEPSATIVAVAGRAVASQEGISAVSTEGCCVQPAKNKTIPAKATHRRAWVMAELRKDMPPIYPSRGAPAGRFPARIGVLRRERMPDECGGRNSLRFHGGWDARPPCSLYALVWRPMPRLTWLLVNFGWNPTQHGESL